MCSLLGLLLPAASLRCQAAGPAGNPARTLLRESVEAAGGMEKMRGWTTRIEKGTFKTTAPGWGNLTAATTRWVMKPDRAKIDNDFSAYDHPFYFTYYTSGGEAWQVVNLGVRQSPEITSRMKEYLEKADGLAYYFAAADTFFLPAPAPADSLHPRRSFERAGCVVRGDTILFDIDRATRLLFRQTEKREGRETVFEDYRETAGRKVPFHVVISRGGEKTEEFLWDTVTFDEKIDSAIFEEGRPQPARTGVTQ